MVRPSEDAPPVKGRREAEVGAARVDLRAERAIRRPEGSVPPVRKTYALVGRSSRSCPIVDVLGPAPTRSAFRGTRSPGRSARAGTRAPLPARVDRIGHLAQADGPRRFGERRVVERPTRATSENVPGNVPITEAGGARLLRGNGVGRADRGEDGRPAEDRARRCPPGGCAAAVRDGPTVRVRRGSWPPSVVGGDRGEVCRCRS